MATVPTFRTWVTGEIVTAAELNSNIRDAGNFFLSWPVFEGRQTVSQSIPNTTSTPVAIDVEDVDTDGGHSISTNTSRYTPATAGRFQLSGGISYAANATGARIAELWKNGAPINGSSAIYTWLAGITTRCPTRTMTAYANGASDYFELYAYQSSGGALSTSIIPSEQSTFSVRMVGTV